MHPIAVFGYCVFFYSHQINLTFNMKLRNYIFATFLVSFVCAAPSFEGRETEDIVSGNSDSLGPETSNFQIDDFVPRSILRKREVEADNEEKKKSDAAQAVSDFYKELQQAYFHDPQWGNMEGKFIEFDDKFEKVKETVGKAQKGVYEADIAHISLLIAGFKEKMKMKKIFDGCDYPGSEVVGAILELKVYVLALENIQGNSIVTMPKERIVKAEKTLEKLQTHRERIDEMVPGLHKMFAAQTEKVKGIIEVLKEDKFSKNELSSEVDANHDDKK